MNAIGDIEIELRHIRYFVSESERSSVDGKDEAWCRKNYSCIRADGRIEGKFFFVS